MFKDELIIIRHARSKYNLRKSEDLDDGISEFGEKQCRNLGSFFEKEVDLTDHEFHTSPFLRCLQTSDIISSRCGSTPIVMPQLREYLNHSGRSVTVINRQEMFPKMNWNVYPDLGELYTEEFNETFLHRMHEAYMLLPSKSVVVTHGLPALTLLHVATENRTHSVPVWNHSIDNCSITIIRRGRLIWHGRNLYHEYEYDEKFYHCDWDGVVKRK
jgi:broad specificity phosphatase PhoE